MNVRTEMNAVMTALAFNPKFGTLDDSALAYLRSQGMKLLSGGWPRRDVIAYLALFEELCPLDEKTALAKMREIYIRNERS